MTEGLQRLMHKGKNTKAKKISDAPVLISDEKRERFHNALLKVTSDRERPTIGTLSEKTIHAVIKLYTEPDEDRHEIPIGTHVADIFSDETIYEIQTRNLKKLGEKLDDYLKCYNVTIVHPVIRKKKIYWIDPDTGEMTVPKRPSPHTGSFESAVEELYGIKDHIGDPRLKVRLILIDADEFRIKDGYGKDNKKYGKWLDKVPTDIIEEKEFERPEDYLQLLPESIPEEFTVKDAVECGMSAKYAGLVIAFLYRINVIDKIGKRGRAYLYRLKY